MSDDVQSMSGAAERVESILDAAERTAADIRDSARAEASRFAEDAEREVDRVTFKRIAVLSEMTENLIERVELLQAQAEAVIRALEDTMRALAATVEASDSEDRPRDER
jgi:vacuolar-type H+-ATPase subunit E/Vma4